MTCVNKATCLFLAFYLVFMPSFAAYAQTHDNANDTNFTPFPAYATQAPTQQIPQPYIDYKPSPAYEQAVDNINRLTADVTKQADSYSKGMLHYTSARADKSDEHLSPYYQKSSQTFAYLYGEMVAFVGDFIAGLGSFATMLFNFLGSMATQMFSFFDLGAIFKIQAKLNAADNMQKVDATSDSVDFVKDSAVLDVQRSEERQRDVENTVLETKSPQIADIESGLVMEWCEQITPRSMLPGAEEAKEAAAKELADSLADRNNQVGAYRGGGGGGGGGTPDGGGGDDNTGDGDASGPTDNIEDKLEADGAAGPLDELNDRAGLIILFCSPNDLNQAAEAFCPATCNVGSDSLCKHISQPYTDPISNQQQLGLMQILQARDPEFKKDQSLYHLDTDFYSAIDSRKTWGLGYYWYRDESGAFTPARERNAYTDKAIAHFFMTHIFRSAVTPLPEYVIEDSIDETTGMPSAEVLEFLLDVKELNAYRSVSQTSFINMIAAKEPVIKGDADSSSAEETLYDYANTILLGDSETTATEPGEPTTEAENSNLEFSGNDEYGPSYDAQIEFLAKKLYMNPKFIMPKTEADFEQKMQIMSATKNIVTYDLMKSLKQQEMLLATMLQIMLDDRKREVEGLSGAVAGGE